MTFDFKLEDHDFIDYGQNGTPSKDHKLTISLENRLTGEVIKKEDFVLPLESFEDWTFIISAKANMFKYACKQEGLLNDSKTS